MVFQHLYAISESCGRRAPFEGFHGATSYIDRHIICANNAYLLRNNDDESVIDIVRISQSEVGIDLEDRIKKLKAYITTL